MIVKFCGAAGTVTGSCHLIEFESGFKILLDCGLYQGSDDEFERFNEKWFFDPSEIDCMILSHAHIDHSGRIPKLCKDGFIGDIYCISATRDLAALMLLDSAEIQEQDARFFNKHKNFEGLKEPLYTVEDAQNCLRQFIGISYERWFKINDSVSILFRDCGHILGSASVTLKIQEDNVEKLVGFSGDIGRPGRAILRDPQPMPELDYLICESTYGGKEHQNEPQDENFLREVIHDTCVKKKGKLIIPAFSIGRTQELIHMMDKLETSGKLPHVEVFIDSPLAIGATEIFLMHPDCYDKDLMKYINIDPNPFGFKNLKFLKSSSESKKLNNYDRPCVIISASGMMQAGRIRHHLYNGVEDSKNTILVVGYCSPGTLGAHIRKQPEEIKIFGKTKKLNARVEVMDSFSAHADHSEMIDFLANQDTVRLKKLFLVHGYRKRQEVFKDDLNRKGFKKVIIPELSESFRL